MSRSLVLLLYYYSITSVIQIVFLTVIVSSQDPKDSVSTCNNDLKGKTISVYDGFWTSITFRTSTASKTLNCVYGSGQHIFPLIEDSQLKDLQGSLTNPNEEEGPFYPNVTYFNNDGSLAILQNLDFHYYGKDQYCITKIHKTSIDIKYCNPGCNGNRPCIKKCCPYDQTYNPIMGDCLPTEKNVLWSPFLYSDISAAKPSDKLKFFPHYIYYLLTPRCPTTQLDTWYSRTITTYVPNYGQYKNERFPFKVLENSSLAYINNARKWVMLDSEHFCIDAIQGYDSAINATGLETEQVVFTCAIPIEQSKLSVVYCVSMYISSMFLLMTCIVYLLLWDKQNVHGWTVFSLVLSMFFWFIFMGNAHLYGLLTAPDTMNTTENSMAHASEQIEPEEVVEEHSHTDNNSSKPFCILNAILAHFFFLSSFSWLTFINFDLFLTFKSLSTVAGRSKGLKKFASYATLSWGFPLIVVIVGISLDYNYSNDRESFVVTPEYGQAYCFVAPWAQGVYIYYIISVLLALNFSFVGMTFFLLYQVKKITGSVRSSKTNKKQETFMLVAKLSVVMGVSWIFEVISWATTQEHTDTKWYWVIMDMYNLLQSVIIFIIFICKRTIMTQLEQKYACFKVLFERIPKLPSGVGKIKKPAGVSSTDASTGNTHSTDANWNKSSLNMKTLGNITNSKADNDSNFDSTIPTLKSFDKSPCNSNAPLLGPSTDAK